MRWHALMGKFIEATKALLDKMTSNNYHWSSERVSSKTSSGKYDVDTLGFPTCTMDALAQQFDTLGAPTPGHWSGMPYASGAICEIYGIQGHMTTYF